MLDVKNKQAVVVGGGGVGRRKVRALLEAGASVRLIDPQAPAEIETQPSLTVIVKPYDPSLLQGAVLVFACTDDRQLNARIARDARAIGAWVNAADQPEDCDFFLPSSATDGPVVLAVGTGGEAPALAAMLRKRLQSHLPEKIGEFTYLLGRIRAELRDTIRDGARRGRILTALADDEVYRDFAAGGEAAVRLRLSRLLQ